MSNLLSLSSIVLEHILVDKIPFALAKRNYLNDKKITNIEKNNVAKIVASALRHYFLLDKKIDENFSNLTTAKKVDIFVFLGNKLYAKIVNEDVANQFLIASLTNKIEDVSEDSINSFIEKSCEQSFAHIEKVEGKEAEFNSILYNNPTWITKMWIKHFNESIAYKTLKANAKKQNKFYLINSSIVDKDEFLKTYPFFEETEYPDLYSYSGKENIKSLECYKNFEVFEYNAAMNHALEKCDIDPFRKVAIYSGTPTNIYTKFISKFSKNYRFDLMTDNSECLFMAKSFAKQLDIVNSMRIYEVTPTSMIACVSEPVHTFIVMPDSSNFAKLGTDPDYFLRFDAQTLDSLIAKQELALKEASNLVEDGGELLYIVPTADRKEGKDIIYRFLKEDDRYVLGEEYQFFPFHKYGTSLYFARLRKKNTESVDND